MEPIPHIGRLIKAEVKRQGMTTVYLSERLGCSRMNVYKMYRRAWITTDMLCSVSLVLNHNFFEDINAAFSKYYDGTQLSN